MERGWVAEKSPTQAAKMTSLSVRSFRSFVFFARLPAPLEWSTGHHGGPSSGALQQNVSCGQVLLNERISRQRRPEIDLASFVDSLDHQRNVELPPTAALVESSCEYSERGSAGNDDESREL